MIAITTENVEYHAGQRIHRFLWTPSKDPCGSCGAYAVWDLIDPRPAFVRAGIHSWRCAACAAQAIGLGNDRRTLQRFRAAVQRIYDGCYPERDVRPSC